jgi:hypothetical protein
MRTRGYRMCTRGPRWAFNGFRPCRRFSCFFFFFFKFILLYGFLVYGFEKNYVNKSSFAPRQARVTFLYIPTVAGSSVVAHRMQKRRTTAHRVVRFFRLSDRAMYYLLLKRFTIVHLYKP